MRAAIRIGIKVSEYNELTPHELFMHIECFNDKAKAEHDTGVVLAYMNASWQRAKRMPDLKKLLGEKAEPKKPQTGEEMLELIKQINVANGGTTY